MTICLFTPRTVARSAQPVVVGGRHSLPHGYALALAPEAQPHVVHLGLGGTSHLRALLDELAARRPSVVVVEHDPAVAAHLALLLAEARDVIGPGTPLLLLASGDVPAAELADAVVAPGAEGYLRAADALCAGGPDGARAALAAVAPVGFEELPCPFASGAIPARLAAETGLDAARRGAGDRFEARSPERVADDLERLDERLSRPILVRLRTAGPADAWSGFPGLYDHLVRRPLGSIALELDLTVGAAARVGAAGLAELGLGGLTLHLDAGIDDVFSREVERTLHDCRQQLALGPGRLRLALGVPGDGYDPEVAHLAELADVYGAGFVVAAADGTAVVPDGAAGGDLVTLQRAVGTLAGPGTRIGGGGAGARTLVLGEGAGVVPRAWLVDELGPDWTVFHPPGSTMAVDGVASTAPLALSDGGPPGPSGAVPVTAELVAAGVPVADVAAGAAPASLLDQGRLKVRTVRTPADLDAFLAAADATHASGLLDPAWSSPQVFLGDSHLWSSSAVPADELLRRVLVDAGGARALLDGRPLGDLAAGRPALVAELERRGAAATAARRCGTCPVAETCSRPPELPRWLDDATYCRVRRARPWLGALVRAPAALRRLYDLCPALHEPGGLGAVRVSGLGGGLFDPAHDAVAARSAVVLVRVGDDHYLYESDDHCSRVGTDLAAVFEAAHALDPDRLRSWVARRYDLGDPERADAVLAAARDHLAAYGFELHRLVPA